jgi:hypothetical protein
MCYHFIKTGKGQWECGINWAVNLEHQCPEINAPKSMPRNQRPEINAPKSMPRNQCPEINFRAESESRLKPANLSHI